MDEKWVRSSLLLGQENMEKLFQSKVAIFGVGGVGSFAAEALARCGIGKFVLVDHDIISQSNINRQIHATTKTVGQWKVDVMRSRMLEINPDADITAVKEFYLPGSPEYMGQDCDYIIDALDTVTAKIELVLVAQRLNIPIISSMGTGNKLNAGMLQIGDLYETKVCPLAKVMRRELRKRGIPHLKCVYSMEEPIRRNIDAHQSLVCKNRQIPGSVSFVPSVAGLLIAGEVIRCLTEGE